MRTNLWSDIVSWQTRRLNNSTKYPLHASMTITSKKKNWNPWENCQKYALKLFWNAYIWHELEGLIFYGQWTNLHDRSQSGPKHVTNAWIDWFHIFITHVNTNSIVMWVTLPNNADSDCVKIPILREILRIQNPHLEELCASSEVIHLFQSVGCVRNKLQFRTVQQNPKSSLWTLDWDWTVYTARDLSDLIVTVLHENTNQSYQARRDPCTNPLEETVEPETRWNVVWLLAEEQQEQEAKW